MPHFVYDNTSLAFPKTNLNVLPPGALPQNYIVDTDWNDAGQAAVDLRDAIKNGKFFGFQEQGVDPSPAGVTNYVWMNNAGILNVKKGVTSYTVVPSTRQVIAGTGLQGGGALSADITLSLAALGPSPAGTYARATVTVDQYGRVTAATANTDATGYATLINDTNAVATRTSLRVDGTNLVFVDDVGNTRTNLNLGSDLSTTSLELATPAPNVSTAGKGRFVYNTSTNRFQVSHNGAAFTNLLVTGEGGSTAAIGGPVTGSTAGSVLFAGAGSTFAQDNANFFWDDAQNRLGIGNAAPDTFLHVSGDAAPVGLFERTTTGTNTWLNTLWVRATTSGDMADGFGPNLLFQIKDSANVNNSLGHLSFVRAGADNTGDFVVFPNTTGTPNERMRLSSAGLLTLTGGGFRSQTSSDTAGFYTTAFFSATTYGSLTTADRELRIQGAGNSGGQRYQYITFNGRWSGNIDSPTLTQGLYDRVSGIEFAAAADSLGPNPNSSINFFVNTGTKGTGAEFTVTPTRAMTITYTARVGIGTVNPSQVFDVEAILGNTNAKFGSALPVYVVSNSPSIGFNAYYNAAWKYGKGSSNHYGGVIGFEPTTGVFSIQTPNSTGNTDGNMTLTTRFSVSSANVITAPGLASTTIDAIVLGSASTGVLRVQVPTSPGFGYDYNNKRLTIGSHPLIMFATIDVTNTGSSMMSLRNSDAYSATSGSMIYLAGDLVPSADGHRLGGLTLGGWSGGGAFYREGASIQAFAEGAWTAGTTHPSYLSFSTTASGASTAAERMRISSAGLVSITGSTGALQLPDSTAAVSAANTARLRYDSPGGVLQVSLSGGAYVNIRTGAEYQLDIGDTVGSGTAGSILFVGSGPTLSQDNANLFWDDTNNILKTTELWLKDHAGFAGSESKTFTNAVQTTDATVTTLQSIALADNTVYAIEISVVGRDTAGTERAMYRKKALVYRQGAGATLQGAVQDVHTDVETSAGLDATIDVDTNDARVRVTGLAATTINWVATINVQAVSTN